MASEEKTPEAGAMDVEVEDIEALDEYEMAFEELENAATKSDAEYQKLLANERVDDVAVKIKEQCIYRLAKIYTEKKQFNDVVNILKTSNDFFGTIPKAKTAKIVRNILNIVATIPDSLTIQVQLCKDVIEWCKIEKRTFLRQRIEARLAALLLQQKEASAALSLINSLLGELKKLDDKQMLTEVHLTESRIYHSLQNIPKSKASLTASRTAANAIYVAPLLQAEIDEMSGTLHCEEGDHTTAFSYFLESFEAYDQSNDPRALIILKYMVLAKVLQGSASEVPSVLSSKLGMKHAGTEDMIAMSAIATAAKARSLEDFQTAVDKYAAWLRNDDLISHQLDDLYQQMMESNLLKIIHPYSVVEISHVAMLIKLPEKVVEKKLSQMILDHKFAGILDQGMGHLIVHDSIGEDKRFTKGVEIITNMGGVVETLLTRAKGLAKTSA
jgi:26S proteasome regulatory subunit N6